MKKVKVIFELSEEAEAKENLMDYLNEEISWVQQSGLYPVEIEVVEV